MTPPCKGMNCQKSDSNPEHSLECEAQHAAAIAGGHFFKGNPMTKTIDALVEALRVAANQNDHDMAMTGDEIRSVRAAIAALEGLEKAEPVAWLVYAGILDKRPAYPAYNTKEMAEHAASQIKSDTEVRPLYTHPAPVQAEPAGWKLVPVEPTEEMRQAAQKAGFFASHVPIIWRALLNAAPKPAAQVAKQAEREDWNRSVMEQAQVFASAWAIAGSRFDSGDGMQVAEQEKEYLRAMLAAAPVAKLQPLTPDQLWQDDAIMGLKGNMGLTLEQISELADAITAVYNKP